MSSESTGPERGRPQTPNSAETASLRSTAATGAGGAVGSPPSAAGLLAPGAKFGRYTIVRPIGAGGMGAVYEATQESPRRSVALKVIRGTLSAQLLRRFEHESQVLGRLQHPGIAQVYEAGSVTDDRGEVVPFFAMELIKGVPLTEYAAQKNLGTRERLELVARICDAVYHAHQKGVIHRDLKPGNILVDESGQPKILDFGVARATDSDIQQTTMQTDIGQLIGTVPYMSPEQVSGDPNDLDTRSDVYALGVIAYELLAGRLPYDLQKKMIHEAVRVIREEDPTRLSSINRTLRGDIETIVAKALEKDKQRRYQSAEALGSDIRRYLKDEPITARPASTWYQAGKFARRNKVLVGGVAATFAVLVAGIIGVSLMLQRALEAERDELLARARVLAEGGRTDEALRAVERAGARLTAQGAHLPAIDLCHAKAEIYYKARTRYPEAALAYRQCAHLGGPRAAEDLFLSARAFSRADRDADAQPAFQSVIQRHPKTVFADQAEFHLARTHALAGRWKDAAVAFDEYVKRWPNGREKREAARYRALAHLMNQDHKKARKLLEDLSGAAEDPLTAARWTNLAALAALRDGDKLHALARWAEVARTRPLSYPALVARARIEESGGAPPPAIDPAEAGSAAPLSVELPPPIDMLHRIGFDGEAEALLREREPVIVAKAEARGTEALCAAYAMLDRGKRRYQVSRQVPQRELATAPGGKNRSAWECLFPRPYAGIVHASAARSRIDTDLVWSVMRQESAFDPDVVSPARAVGLMQLMPETARTTAKSVGLEHDDSLLTSPSHSIALGSLYLRAMLDAFHDNVVLAVAAYNAGPEAIQRWLGRAKGQTLDVFVEAIPFVETRGYVAKVVGNLARYGYMDRGEAGVPVLGLELK